MMFKRTALLIVALLIAIAVFIYWHPWTTQPSTIEPVADNAFGKVLSEDDDGFDRALQPRKFSFPDDYGPHHRYRTEWWYFTGNLSDLVGRKFGYELTFFRFALSPATAPSASAWRTSQMYMAHLALTDVAAGRFYSDERFSRAGNGLAGARSDRYHVWLYDWSASAEGTADFPLRLQAKSGAFGIDLRLKTQKAAVLQGDRGLSRKSSEPGNASYYYSFTRLATAGTLSVAGEEYSVGGASWMDREWSTSALAAEQAGWDWFALQLSDNSELMFYQFRRKDGQPDSNSSGALFPSDGAQIPLNFRDVTVNVLDTWKSPHSKITYPSRWRLSIPSRNIVLEVVPLINDQELNLGYRYWEGAAAVRGTRDGNPIDGQGYVELTGY
jgi:predicted secreted hydrolase